MSKELLFINIGYENGLYTFKNDDVCSEIPESIMVNTPFYNQENSFEELVDTISMEPEDDIVFAYHYYNQKLVKRLAVVLAEEYGKKIYFVNPEELDFQRLTEMPVLNCPEEETQGYFAAMRNGYDAFVTGIYPDNLSNTLAKHYRFAEKICQYV